jgi:hypothetical protein
MIRAVSWMIKTALFAAFILVLGNWIHWGGKTVSDQVKTEMSQVQRSGAASSLKTWERRLGKEVKEDATTGLSHKVMKIKKSIQAELPSDSTTSNSDGADGDKIPSSERQKLRALIQELNTSTSANISHEN